MRVAVVGAGVAGLTTAKVLLAAGHEVQVYDSAPDVGGVWSASRRYPGLTTQSPRRQYEFSDLPMPREYPEWPTGAQVQEYLAAYAAHFGLDPVLRLWTTVTAARRVGPHWELSVGDTTETFDRLVVANGVFCEPVTPSFDGVDSWTAAGGIVCAATDFHDAATAAGKDVLVVGYGKTACDVAVPVSEVAASTHVVARQLLWKVPRKIAGVVNFKMLLLTRMGEALFRYIRLRGMEKFLHGPGNGVRRKMLNSLGTMSVRQFGLARLGLVPRGQMEDIVRGAIGLVTDGFYEAVEAGKIVVDRDTTVTRLLVRDGRPHAELADGTVLPADLVVCATGFSQGVPFLEPEVQEALLDERGNFMLYRQLLPLTVPGLYFNGYNSSFFSPLNAEAAALWIVADLAGAAPRPDPAEMREAVVAQLTFMDDATNTHHCRGTKIIPFSIHNVDEVLDDLDLNIPARTRASHWLNPVAPAAYRGMTEKLVARIGRAPAPAPAPTPSPEPAPLAQS